MLNRLTYIFMIILLAVASLATAQEAYVIDEVCRGTQRSYRVEGEETATWVWSLKDAADNELDISASTAVKFTDTNSLGETIYGSELTIDWDFDPAIYSLAVEQTSSFGCHNHELGTIEILPAPEAYAGDPLAICSDENIQITTATAANYTDLIWTTDGDGTFDDTSILDPIYTPGTNDIASGIVNFTLTANGLISGTGCLPQQSNTSLTIYPIPILSITDPAAVCYPTTIDLSDAAVTAGSSLPASTVISYWEDAALSIPFANHTAVTSTGTYYIKAEADGACIDIQSVDVVINPLPILSITDPDPVCYPTTIDLTSPAIVAGSESDLAYTFWADNNGTVPLASPDAIPTTGIYYMKATNPATGCFVIEPVNVTVNPQPIVVITTPDPICAPLTFDLSDPAIIAGSTEPAGSIPSYWEDSSASISLTNFSSINTSGTYYIKIEAPGGCFDIQAVDLTIYPIPTLAVTNPDPVCAPTTIDLTAPAIVAGSEVDLAYTFWNDINATNEIVDPTTVSSGGIYYIQATNTTTGCSTIEQVELTIHPVPNLVITDPAPVCEPATIDLTDAFITAGSEVGLTYSYWEDNNTSIALADFDAVNTGGTYYIKATNPITSCEVVKAVELTIHAQPILTITDPAVVCEPETIDLSLAEVTAGSDVGMDISYWEDVDASIPLVNYIAISTAGTYYIKATNPLTNCETVNPVQVSINAIPGLLVTEPDPVCEPETIDLSDLDITAGSEAGLDYSYWEDLDATIALAEFNVLSVGGTYYIKAVNPLTLCEVVTAVDVVINENPDLTISNPDDICAPATIDLSDPAILAGSIIPDNSVTTYWMDREASSSLSNPTAVSSSGRYYIMVQAPGGCSDIDSVDVDIHPIPSLIITDPAEICEPATIDLSIADITIGSEAGLDFTYWEDIDATLVLADHTAIATGGTYFIKGSNPLTGCSDVKAVNVIINEQPELIISNPEAVCEPATIDLSDPSIIAGSTIPAGTTYSYWEDISATIPLTNFDAVDATATYYIRVESPGICTDIKAVDVTVNPLPQLIITNPDAVCSPATVDLTDPLIVASSDAGLDYSYWSDVSATVSISDPSAISLDGSYYIQAINPATNCGIVKEVIVTIHPIPNLVINDPDPVCQPTTIDLADPAVTLGSEANLTFTYWNDRDATTSLDDYNSITAGGKYYIKAINTITGCEDIDSVEVIINTVPVLVINTPDEVCAPQTINLENNAIIFGSSIPPASIISYWKDLNATIAVTDPEHISTSGTYYIKVISGTDCFDIQPVELTIHPAAILSITDPNPVCAPDVIDLTNPTVTQGSDTDLPLTYWTDNAATIPLADPTMITASGTYYIFATKGGICPVIKAVNVVINTPPSLVINDPAAVCAPATIDLTEASIIAGSTFEEPATFSYWKDIDATQPLANYTAINTSASYYIKIEAPGGCSDVQAVNVIVNPQPTLVINDPAPVCEPETIDLTADAITPGLDPTLSKTYWTDEFASNSVADPTQISVSGTYYIMVKNEFDCPNIQAVQVIVNKPDNLVFNMNTTFCVNSTAPALPTTAQGGITGSWIPASITTTSIGKFNYVFTPDPGQCANINTVEISITDQIIPLFDPMGPYCLGGTPPPLPTTSTDGITGTWNPATINTDNLGFFDYTFTPTPGQCAGDTTVSIEINEIFSVFANVENVKCKGENTGSISLHISGGSGSYSYVWSNSNWTGTRTSRNISGLAGNQTYNAVVTDQVSMCQNTVSVFVQEPALNDDEAPVVTNAPTQYVQCDTDWPAPFASISEFTAAGGSVSDNQEFNPASFKFESETISTDHTNTILERRYSVLDYCNNIGYTTHLVIAKDDTDPTAVCNSIEIGLDQNGVYQLTQVDIQTIANGSSDNCAPVDQLSLSFTPMIVDCEMVGETITGTLVVTDLSGNSDSCQTTIQVVDKLPPVIACQDIDLYLNADGETQLDTSLVITHLSDNCGIDTVIISKTDFNCSEVGSNAVTITAYDIHGLSDFCTFNAEVHDTIRPSVACNDLTITLDASEQFELKPEMISSGIADNCDIASVVLSKTEFGCADIGDTPVTVTVTDVNGNHNSCIATITTVLDNEPPVANDDEGYVVVTAAPIAIPVLDNDTDNNAITPSSLSIFIDPPNGSVSINANNEIVYISDPTFIGTDEFSYIICDEGIPCYPLCDTAKVVVEVLPPNNAPVANVDHFQAGCYPIEADLLLNDYDPDGEDLIINTTALLDPRLGILNINDNGKFLFEFERGISGLDWFIYEICDDNYFPLCDTAIVYINIFTDFDCDNIPNSIDIDDDNDGIVDWLEGDGAIDSDGDGTPDSLDIDSDGDGIPDNIEAQSDGDHKNPSGEDENENGLDDIYETSTQLGLTPVDTDGDNQPDYLDHDTDNDGVPDKIEGYDIGAKGIAEIIPEGYDDDNDGLDDGYDSFFGGFNENDLDSPYGVDPQLQDFDSDGTRDWRDIDDDDDGILTRYEDLNNNGDYADDDLDFDGHPEYLDYQGDCTLFIPEGFSPDGDGIHDYFQVHCIQNYPDAKMMIFDRDGNLLFQKEHYGNYQFWGEYGSAWWNGDGPNGKVLADVYLYILDKGNGKLERGFVMVSY